MRDETMSMMVEIKRKWGDFRLDMQFQAKSRRIGILGASGCGKSMTLKSIAGIEKPDQGRISINGKTLFDSSRKINLKPQKRNIGYLFQNYALFPTMTVRENIGAGLRVSKEKKKVRVEEMIEKFRLHGLADRLPGELSGGQQQRAALARIMAYEPDAILLDEPFSALDVFLKDRLQREMAEMLADYPGIVLLVSHSRDEIYRFCEELLIMEKGSPVIFGKTREIFANPVYREAARLTGCKNIAKIQLLDDYTADVPAWGVRLHMKRTIPKDAACIGYRAHDFVPVWGDGRENCIKIRPAGMAELPFENNYYLLPETEAAKESGGEDICWFVQRDTIPEIRQKGLPDYLQIQEEKTMFLKEKS